MPQIMQVQGIRTPTAVNASSRPGHPHTRSIAMRDVDNFKGVNDNWGHETGDRVPCGHGRIGITFYHL
jgi:diguanylate cyclase (GGDEF)-like protein